MEPELICDGYTFIEGPRMDAAGNLYFSDIIIGGVFRRAPDGKVKHVLAERKSIGGLALNEDGRVVVAGEGPLLLVDIDTGHSEILADMVGDLPIGSVNDVQPDGDGGLYAGLIDPDMTFDSTGGAGARAKAMPLIHIGPDRTVRTMAEGFKISNGIGLSPDRKRLYQAETLEGVYGYDRSEDGSLANRELLFRHNFTDGLAVDAQGFIWIAAVQDGAIKRFSPDGQFDRSLDLPVTEVSSLTFGGVDCRDLYVVTGSDLGNPGRTPTGRIYRFRSDVAGLPTALTHF